MSGEKYKKYVLILIGAFGMLIGILSVFLFQYMTAAHPHEKPPKLSQQGPRHEPLTYDSFFDEDPWVRMKKMRQQMMKDFDNFNRFSTGFTDDQEIDHHSFGSSQKTYTLTHRETDESVIYEIHLQSDVEGESVNVSVENGMVTISGKKVTTNKNEDDAGKLFFSSSSLFSQSFSVPQNVDAENVKMTNRDNIITMTFPKKVNEV